MRKKKGRRLHLECLETRNLLSPMQGLAAQSLLSFTPPDQMFGLMSTVGPKADGADRQDATDAPKAALESDGGNGGQNEKDHSTLQGMTDSSNDDQGNHQSNKLLDDSSASMKLAGDQNGDSNNANDNNPGALADSSDTDHGNHQAGKEKEDHADSNSGTNSSQSSNDQKEQSSNTGDNNTSQGESDKSSMTDGASTDGSKNSADHSKDGENSKNNSDGAKAPTSSDSDSHSNAGGGQKGLGDSDNSKGQGGSTDGLGGSSSTGEQGSSGTQTLPAVQTKDQDEGAGAVVSDKVGQIKGNLGDKENSSSSTDQLVSDSVIDAQSSPAGQLPDSHSTSRLEARKETPAADSVSVRPAGSIAGTSGVLLDSAPLAASLAAQALEIGSDSMLPAVPYVADTAVQVLHSGVEVVGMGEMAAVETLSVGAYDLLLGFLPVGQESLDQAMQGFLNQLEDLGEQLTGSETGIWLYPTMVAALVIVGVASRRRRQTRKQQIWTLDRASWMGSWFPSTLQS